jgi:hypothetical protein
MVMLANTSTLSGRGNRNYGSSLARKDCMTKPKDVIHLGVEQIVIEKKSRGQEAKSC